MIPDRVRFDEYELDGRRYALSRAGRMVKLERIPMELLLFLVERKGELITREQIAEKLWGTDVFLDTDNGINTAIRKIRHALNDDAEQSRFVQTVPAKGYRFVAPITPVEIDSPAPHRTPENEVTSNPYVFLRFGITHLAVAGLAVVLMVGGSMWRVGRSGGTTKASAPVIRSVAVMPFENLTGDPSQDYVSDGITDVLTTDLARIGALRVVSRTSSMRFKGSRKPLSEIARELGVDALVEGTILRTAQRVRVTAQVIHANPEGHVWADQYDRPLGDVADLQIELAHAISHAIQITLTPRDQSQLAGGHAGRTAKHTRPSSRVVTSGVSGPRRPRRKLSNTTGRLSSTIRVMRWPSSGSRMRTSRWRCQIRCRRPCRRARRSRRREPP